MFAELVDNATTTEQLKLVKLFKYMATATNLTDGMLVDADLTNGATYGFVHCVQKAGASARGLIPVGVVDQTVTASATGVTVPIIPGDNRLIRVVVAGYKVDVLGDGSVAAGYGFVSDANAYATNAAAITDAIVGYAWEADAGAGSGFDAWILPRLCLGM